MNMIEDKINLQSNESKLIVFEVSKFPIVTVPGSIQSINLIEHLLKAQDELFNTKISYIVEEKWNRHYNVIVR